MGKPLLLGARVSERCGVRVSVPWLPAGSPACRPRTRMQTRPGAGFLRSNEHTFSSQHFVSGNTESILDSVG